MKSQRLHFLAALVCAAAIAAPALAQNFRGPSAEQLAAAKAFKTPMMNDKPDLTGFWGNFVEFGSAEVIKSTDGKKVEFQLPPPLEPRTARPGAPLAQRVAETPAYKPELLAKVEQLRVTDVDTDPSFICNPHGTPRAGIPQEIFQSKDAVVLLYQTGQRSDYRVIPTDGRKFDDTLDPSWYGDSVGRWEGATLVIDSVNFTDESWLGGGGWFHSDKMKVTERLTREGNTLRWEAIVTDAEVLLRPWIVPPRTVVLGKAGAHLVESPPCHERDQAHMVDKYHITP